MGRGGDGPGREPKVTTFEWEEIKKHNFRDDQWIVVDRNVYDISRWASKHPGGARIISHYAGEDATDAWTAFHNDKEYVTKFLKPLHIGKVHDEFKEKEISSDFRSLRKTAEKMDLFRTNIPFFLLHLGHILVMEVVAYWIIRSFGCGWIPYLTAALLHCILQAQAGWSQHDYGHLSVFHNSRLDHFMHLFVIGFLKGASSHWWNFRHFQHHAKPNIMKKDPDITIPYLFLLGNTAPVEWGKKKKGFMPYRFQHDYFFLIGPPLLLPIYFHYENVYFVLKRKDWLDLTFILSYFVKHFYLYGPFMGAWGAFWFYMFFRCLESHWFTWVTQMNHIPMEIDHDVQDDWLTMQLKSTCNVDPSWFNNWFTGHLNFQIEHHLFPTMPRHNYIHIRPLVKSLCKKHGLNYQSKSLLKAFADIVTSLRHSGQLYYEAYYHV